MRHLHRFLIVTLVFLSQGSIVCAAEDAGQQGNSSPLVWVIIFLPSAIIILLFFMVRRSQKAALGSMKRFDEHRTFVEGHMRRLESQVENLDKKLGRLIEVIEGIERGQKRDQT